MELHQETRFFCLVRLESRTDSAMDKQQLLRYLFPPF